jgi:hypothetical protein
VSEYLHELTFRFTDCDRLAENVSLIFVCYQFLLDRFKDDDLNSGLAQSLLELMSTFTTLTKDKMEKTHLVKILPRYQKKGNAKVQHWVKKILANSETATKEAVQKKPEVKVESPARKPSGDSVAGVKRPAASSTEGTAVKKVAGGFKQPGVNVAARTNGGTVVKKPETSKVTPTPASTLRKTVVAKPSGFFSSLQSAAKKPGTSNAEKSKPATTKAGPTPTGKPVFSFAETMANLSKPKKEEKPMKAEEKSIPNETPEEKAKRIRKEQRRKLHVSFKPGDELVQIRYFTHDPDEEIDHDSGQMRDVTEVGGEGRALKQHHNMMDVDDDEDDSAEEEQQLMDFRPPIPVDFSVVEKEERDRNYAKFGGGVLQPQSEERPKRESYERNTLMVFYSNTNDIPPNPKEPESPYNGDQASGVKLFGLPDEKFAARGQHRRSRFPASAAAPGFDLSALLARQQQQQQPAPVPGQDIQSILASLRPQQAPTYQAPFPSIYQAPPPVVNPTPHIDLAAILAQIQGTAPQSPGGSDPKVGNPFYKTKACRFWQEGRCQKGDACSYLHES